jgi:hypothetical protein
VQNANELCDKIVRAAVCVTSEMLAITWLEAECPLDVCSVTNGAHIEMY